MFGSIVKFPSQFSPQFKEICVSDCRWWVGEWQKCSASCGTSGVAKRTVMCIQAISVDDQKALPPSQCESIPKPESVLSCNTDIPCPADWTTGNWSKVSVAWNTTVHIMTYASSSVPLNDHLGKIHTERRLSLKESNKITKQKK